MSYMLGDSDDTEIQFVGGSGTGIVDCGICCMSLDNLTVDQRAEHYEFHFNNTPAPLKPSQGAQSDRLPPSPMKKTEPPRNTSSRGKGKEKQTENTNSNGGVFWHRGLSTPPPRNYTQGLIPLLKKALWSSHAQGTTQRAVLCSERTIHVSRTSLDNGWGCGYRNFQMACTALMDQTIQPKYSSLLSEPSSPGIRDIQKWIEDAWKAGFDPQGAKQLKNLVGTKKWLGTADLYVAFTYRGIPAELVDINLTDRPQGAEIVKDWIVDYFSPKQSATKSTSINEVLRGASPIVVSDCMPVILQHQGHSRTIVGYEVTKTGKIKLLMFDSTMILENSTRKAAQALCPQNTCARKRPLGATPSTLRPSTKRSRSDTVVQADDEDIEILVIDSSPDRKLQEENVKPVHCNSKDSAKTLQKFLDRSRLHTRSLGRMEYQILYFPMKSPLTERDKLSRKRVTSTKY